MAASPKYKVYDAANQYQGCAKQAELAAMMAIALGQGATVRLDHAKRWTLYTVDDATEDGACAAADCIVEVEARLHAQLRGYIPTA